MIALKTSLLTAVDSTSHIHLIVGSSSLASSRATKSSEVGAQPIILAPESADVHFGLQRRIDDGAVQWVKKEFEEKDLYTLGRTDNGGWVDAVFVAGGGRNVQNSRISELCIRNRVPVNVVDAPHLCTFTLLSTHTDGPLQIGITTNGAGCKLSSRIRREIASSLPPNLGLACQRLGSIRKRLQSEDRKAHSSKLEALEALGRETDFEDEESLDQSAAFNQLVLDDEAAKGRRMRWLSQICEYWPLRRLAEITDADVDAVMSSYTANSTLPATPPDSPNRPSGKRGRIILAGSGPGHPDLLTRATHKAILSADIILADKLVPAGVLDLIPRRTPVHIARKFPGNAEKAQEELLTLGLAGLEAGKTVLRLKQGDPYIYGRGGEEFDFFRSKGFGDRISVLPGITSALSAPLFSQIPATQRAVSDQVLICTGTGRKGAPTAPPTFVKTQTVVFLMALHRIGGLVEDLTTFGPEERAASEGEVRRSRDLWPLETPCAVIERASCPDQRVIRTTLEFVNLAIETEGSRPPGLLVLGKACEVLMKPDATEKWQVEDGFKGLEDLGDDAALEGVLTAWSNGVMELDADLPKSEFVVSSVPIAV